MKRIIILTGILFLLMGIVNLFAQRINATVTVRMDHLQPRDQQDLADLQQKLTDYINQNKWSDANQDIVLDCNVQIIVETATSRGSEKVYRAQFLISSPSGENYYDKAWEFKYVPGQPLEPFRTSFDPLLDMVDYYIYMVLGGEMDTYELFAGTPFYDHALDITNQGLLSNYATGWKKRQDQVILITDADHVALREAKFYYYEGLYFVEEEPNKEYARKFAKAVMKRLEQLHNKRPNSAALKRFLDAHFQEFCKLFQYDVDRTNIDKMLIIDARHRDTYQNCQFGK